MAQCALRDLGVVDFLVALQHPRQLTDGIKPRLFQQLIDAAVEALDHTVRLWAARLGQTVLDAMLCTQLVKGMVAGGLAFSGGAKPVGKFLAIVGQNLDDPERGGGDRSLQKTLRRGRRFTAFNLQINPACGPVIFVSRSLLCASFGLLKPRTDNCATSDLAFVAGT